MTGAAFGGSTPTILVVRVGAQPQAPVCLPPETGFLCHEVHWPSGLGRPLPGQPDLIILDFPPTDSMDFSLCPHIKARVSRVPVIVIGADTQTDRIISLELGADDYLSKPFHPKELAARARAILRSCGRQTKAVASLNRISARWSLDPAQRRLVTPNGETQKLNPVDYWLLQRFMTHPDQILSRDDLAAYLHGKQSIPYTPLSISVFVNTLREKLGDTPPFSLIRTVRGKGYVFSGRP